MESWVFFVVCEQSDPRSFAEVVFVVVQDSRILRQSYG